MIEVKTQAQLEKALKKTDNGSDELIVCIGGGDFTLRENSTATLRENSTATLLENSTATLRENSTATLWGNSTATLLENSTATLLENSTATLRGNSTATLRGNSTATLWGNSTARAWERSRVEAAKSSIVMQHSPAAKIKGGLVIEMTRPGTGAEWCEFYGVEIRKGGGLSRKLAGQDVAILFKAVGEDFVSSRGCAYVPGTSPSAPDWDGGDRECGGGLHFSPHPLMAEEFHVAPDHFVACPVLVSEIVVHPNGAYPQKVKAPRVAAPCWEVDKNGKRVDR